MSEDVVYEVAENYEKLFTQDHATRVCYVELSIGPATGQSQMPIFATRSRKVFDLERGTQRGLLISVKSLHLI